MIFLKKIENSKICSIWIYWNKQQYNRHITLDYEYFLHRIWLVRHSLHGWVILIVLTYITPCNYISSFALWMCVWGVWVCLCDYFLCEYDVKIKIIIFISIQKLQRFVWMYILLMGFQYNENIIYKKEKVLTCIVMVHLLCLLCVQTL